MKHSSIEIQIIDDQGDILDVQGGFQTIKSAKERVSFMLKYPETAFDSAHEIENYHKRVYTIRLASNHGYLNEWFPKFYDDGGALQR